MTLGVWLLVAEFGDNDMRVGTGYATVNDPARVAVPPPGAGFATTISLGPIAASGATVMPTVICVKLFAVAEFIVMPGPELTVVTPA
jgi:hypothetical protein